MARFQYLILCLYAVLQLLITPSHAYHHRLHGHQRRIALHSGRTQRPSATRAQITQEQISKIKADLVDVLSLRDSAVHLLDYETLSQLPKRNDLQIDNDGPGDEIEPADYFLEDLQKKLKDLNQMLKALSNLLANFGIQSEPSTSTTTTGKGSSLPTSSSMVNSTVTPVDDSSTVPANSSQSTTSPATAPTARYTFEPASSSNVAVYYGQTDQTSNVPISTICADPNVDIIVLAFIHKLSTDSAGYPGLNLGAKCWAANNAQISAGAIELIDCVSDGFSEQVKTCQSTGKKILLSIGGAVGYSETTIASEQDAVRIADNIWGLFGPGGLDDSNTKDIRPFGDFVFDGFDIDNEDQSTLYWPTLISTLRNHFLDHQPSTNTTSTTHKPYYLSAAPQCPRPDASIPLSSLQSHIDYIFVQFYNNPQCNLNVGPDFLSSLQAWSSDLIDPPTPFLRTNNGVDSPMVYIGGPAWPGAGSGWVAGQTYRDIMAKVPGLDLPNLGGAMFWDGAYGELSGRNDDAYGRSGLGRTYMELAKDKLS